MRTPRPASCPQDDQKIVVEVLPPEKIGISAALRDSYVVDTTPEELNRLLNRIR